MHRLKLVAFSACLALACGDSSNDGSSSSASGSGSADQGTAATESSASGGTASASGSGTSATAGTMGSGGETGGTGNNCDTRDELYVEGGCDTGPDYEFPPAGCYLPCEGSTDECPEGTCKQAWINPCICPPGQGCCAACGAEQWLCLN